MASAIEDDAGADQVLAAERDHLASSREFLRLMREDVLALPALAGDRVSQEYLKADLHRRAESLRDLPDAPLFFGRLDYAAGATAPAAGPGVGEEPDESWQLAASGFHIGRRHVHDPDGHPVVIDWRAPVSRPFYRASQGDPMGLVQAAPVRLQRWSADRLRGRELRGLDPAGPARRARDGRPRRPAQPAGHRGDRAAQVGLDARHRRDDPARPGRHRAGERGRVRLRPGRARDREDGGRPAPRRLSALRAPGADEPRWHAGPRAEPGFPRLHPQRPARAGRVRRRADVGHRADLGGADPRRRLRAGGPAQGRCPDGRGTAPGAMGAGRRAGRADPADPRLTALAGAGRTAPGAGRRAARTRGAVRHGPGDAVASHRARDPEPAGGGRARPATTGPTRLSAGQVRSAPRSLRSGRRPIPCGSYSACCPTPSCSAAPPAGCSARPSRPP